MVIERRCQVEPSMAKRNAEMGYEDPRYLYGKYWVPTPYQLLHLCTEYSHSVNKVVK